MRHWTVPLYRDEAIVLRTHDLGEADRIVSLLSRDNGRVRAVAKGVRRVKSRFGARLEPFSRVDVQCYEGRSLDTVTQVESLSAYGASLCGDYPRWTAGTAMLEAVERLTPVEKESATRQYLLLVGALRTLVAATLPAGLVLDAFLLRSLAVAGWSPSFADCARCGREGPHTAFHIGSGGMVCQDCRPAGAARPRPDTLELLGALMSGEWDRALGSENRARAEASGLVGAFLQWHLERGLRSWPMVERV